MTHFERTTKQLLYITTRKATLLLLMMFLVPFASAQSDSIPDNPIKNAPAIRGVFPRAESIEPIVENYQCLFTNSAIDPLDTFKPKINCILSQGQEKEQDPKQEQEKKQSEETPPNFRDSDTHNYVFVSYGNRFLAGRTTRAVSVGAGFEHYDYAYDRSPGIGVAVEGGVGIPAEQAGELDGLVSLNFPVRFFQGSVNDFNPRVQLFITPGYTFMFGRKAKSRWNTGVGVLLWISDTKGIRIEVRDYFPITNVAHGHGVEFRVALISASWEDD